MGDIALIGVGGGMGIVPGTESMFKEGEYLRHSKETVSDSDSFLYIMSKENRRKMTSIILLMMTKILRIYSTFSEKKKQKNKG